MDPKILFDLGWDFGRYRVTPDTTIPEVLQGFRAAREHFGPSLRHHDRFIRKWLTLRLSAASRGRAFDPNVTPEFIKSIDVPFCPITRKELTHGLRADTDWSVDRIVNDGAYAVGNLAVMSAGANQQKNRHTFTSVMDMLVAISKGEVPMDFVGADGERLSVPKYFGLTLGEWGRLASLTAFVDTTGSGSSFPMALTVPPGIPVFTWHHVLRIAASRYVSRMPRARRRVIDDSYVSGKKAKELWRRLVTDLAHELVKHYGVHYSAHRGDPLQRAPIMDWAIEDAWFCNMSLAATFNALCKELSSKRSDAQILSMLLEKSKTVKRLSTRDQYNEDLCLSTRGFYLT